MDLIEIRSELAEIAERQVDTPEGVHWVRVRDEFAAHYPDAMAERAEQLAWGELGNLAKNAIKPLRTQTTQMSLPGMDRIPGTVTVPDGEGSYRVKSTRWATDPDLEANERIHNENITAAIAAHQRVRDFNRLIRPVMAEHGFTYAGEAIEHLTQGELA